MGFWSDFSHISGVVYTHFPLLNCTLQSKQMSIWEDCIDCICIYWSYLLEQPGEANCDWQVRSHVILPDRSAAVKQGRGEVWGVATIRQRMGLDNPLHSHLQLALSRQELVSGLNRVFFWLLKPHEHNGNFYTQGEKSSSTVTHKVWFQRWGLRPF